MQVLAQKVSNQAYEKYKSAFRHQDIIKKLHSKGEKFIDEEFPPKFSSISKTNEVPSNWRSFTFKRSTEFMDPSQIQVFRGIDPNDIRQGSLGDCYLLCSFSVLAERPKLIKRIFITEQYNDEGCYAVWLNDNGSWKSIVLDDYFPCTPNGGPVFTKSNGPELWVLLLEKAYAKMYGGYDIIEGGVPPYALRDLTGAPYDFLESSDPQEVWNMIKDSDRHKYLLTCYTKGSDIKEEKNPLGIVAGHAYSILDAKEVHTAEGVERILQVRNPWGKFEWKGDWGDDSSKWTPDVIKQVENFTRADDGTFWMNVNDFVKYYEGVGVCKVHDDYYYRSMNLRHEKPMPREYFATEDSNIPYENPNYSMIRLKVDQNCHLFLSLNQMDERKFTGRKGDPYIFSIARMLLAKVEPFGLRFIDGIFYNDRNIVIEQTLNPGIYVITIEIMWEQDYYRDFNLSAYSQYPVDFEEISRADINHVQRNIVKSMILSDPQAKIKDYSGIKEPEIKKYTGSNFGIAYFYYQNNSNTGKTLVEAVTLTQRENLRIVPPFTNNSQFEVTVLPHHDALVVYKCLNGRQYVFATKTNFRATVLPVDETTRLARMPYAETTYLDDVDDAINISADTDYYDEFIRDDRDNPEIFDYGKVAEDMKNAGFAQIRSKEDILVQRENKPKTDTTTKQATNPKTKDVINLLEGANFVDPFVKKKEQVQILVQPTEDPLRERKLLSLEVLGNFPKYIKDESDYSDLPIQNFELNYNDIINEKIPSINRYLNFGSIGVTASFLCLTLLLSFLRAEFLDLTLLALLFGLLFTRTSALKPIHKINLLLRAVPYIVFASTLFDIMWLAIYQRNWIERDIIDRTSKNSSLGLLNGVKRFDIGLTYLQLLIKILFGAIFQYQVIETLKVPSRPGLIN